MFSLRERLIACEIWACIWGLGSLVTSLWFLFSTVGLSLAALRSPLFVAMILLAIPTTAMLTLILAPIAAFVLFSGVVDRQIRRNDGPFTVGDRVMIIPGHNARRTATVTSFGQCQSLRITIDGDEEETGAYSHHQLKRI